MRAAPSSHPTRPFWMALVTMVKPDVSPARGAMALTTGRYALGETQQRPQPLRHMLTAPCRHHADDTGAARTIYAVTPRKCMFRVGPKTRHAKTNARVCAPVNFTSASRGDAAGPQSGRRSVRVRRWWMVTSLKVSGRRSRNL
jgi:hypothetical protein